MYSYNSIFASFQNMMNSKLQLITSGSNSQIYLYGQAKAKLVLKVVPTTCTKQSKHLSNQFKMLRSLDHECIVKPIKYQQNFNFNGNKQNSQLRDIRNVLVMEYAQKGSLIDYFKASKLEIFQIKGLIKKITQGIKHMHYKGIAHRDLKLDNILVFQQKGTLVPKIADFGFASQCYTDGQMILFNEYKGTKKGYMAPQIHALQKNSQLNYDAMKTDIFSLGVIFFSLVIGRLPFEYAIPQSKLYSKIVKGEYDSFWQMHREQTIKLQDNQQLMFQEFKELLNHMLCYNPSQRYSISQVTNSAWFKSL